MVENSHRKTQDTVSTIKNLSTKHRPSVYILVAGTRTKPDKVQVRLCNFNLVRENQACGRSLQWHHTSFF
jgi:hypothetical protein